MSMPLSIDEKRNAKELCDGTKLTPFEDGVVDIHLVVREQSAREQVHYYLCWQFRRCTEV